MWAKAKMGARDEVMKNEPKSLKLVKEPCMQCLFAVRPERWRRFRGMVCIGKGEKERGGGKCGEMRGNIPLAELRSSLIKLSKSLMHGASPCRGRKE